MKYTYESNKHGFTLNKNEFLWSNIDTVGLEGTNLHINFNTGIPPYIEANWAIADFVLFINQFAQDRQEHTGVKIEAAEPEPTPTDMVLSLVSEMVQIRNNAKKRGLKDLSTAIEYSLTSKGFEISDINGVTAFKHVKK